MQATELQLFIWQMPEFETSHGRLTNMVFAVLAPDAEAAGDKLYTYMVEVHFDSPENSELIMQCLDKMPPVAPPLHQGVAAFRLDLPAGTTVNLS